MLFLAVSGVPLVLTWWLAGPEARRDLAGIDLLLAGAAGGAIGMFAAAVPGLLYAVGVSYGMLPDPPYILLSDHSEWALAGLLMLAALVCAWLGYVAGLAYVLLEIGRRRAAGAVLLSPLVTYVLGTGACAVLAHFGVGAAAGWARSRPRGNTSAPPGSCGIVAAVLATRMK